MNKIAETFDNFLAPFDDEEIKLGFGEDFQKNKIIAMIAYICPILFFLPIISNKYSPFCKFHANQSLLWLIVCIVLNVIGGILGIIPLIGKIVQFIVSLAVCAAAILLAYGAYTGKAVKLPVVGDMLKVF
ncbi:MAG: DUF4870 domain-containing protein [Ruminococcus sp.]|nr:DUF4870 domain-containing protein [Ruminococcus sp.]